MNSLETENVPLLGIVSGHFSQSAANVDGRLAAEVHVRSGPRCFLVL